MEIPSLPAEMRASLPPAVQAYIAAIEAQLATLSTRVEQLEARIRQHSGNSSRPPSSDPPETPPRPTRPPTGRRPGGQVGHPGHRRALLPSSQVDEIVVHRPEQCDYCGTAVPADAVPVGEVRRAQVWELPPVQPIVVEHQYPTLCCPRCQRLVGPVVPTPAETHAFGPTVVALVGLLHGRFRLSAREVVALLGDLFGVPVSLGSVPALYAELGDALGKPYSAVHEVVTAGPQANVDETGWKQAGQRRWLWVAVATAATLFLVATSRSAQTLTRLLGAGFAGLVGSDRFSAYRGLPPERRQMCWAHLARSITGFAAWGGQTGPWGKEAGAVVEEMFATWSRFRAGELDRAGLQLTMQPIQTQMRTLLERGSDLSPPRALCQDLLALWPALWTFLTVDDIEPTNNAAERALRPAVLWRKGCFGAHSAAGNVFVERILTIAATCRQQQRHLLTFLTDAVHAHRSSLPAPALIATP